MSLDANSTLNSNHNNQKGIMSNININNESRKQSTISNKLENDENEEEELVDNLKFNTLITNPLAFPAAKRSSTESLSNKFSIDLPNVSKQKIHEYLNDDLINAIDASPNTPLTQKISSNQKMSLIEDDSLKEGSKPTINININMSTTQKNIINNIVPVALGNKMNIVGTESEGLKAFDPQNLILNNNTQNLNILQQLKMEAGQKNQSNFNLPMNYPASQSLPPNTQNTQQSVSLNEKIPQQNDQKNTKKSKDKKGKKGFEIRDGDWACFSCSNLNFAFRNKCNRCGMSKEDSIKNFDVANYKLMMSMRNNVGFRNYGMGVGSAGGVGNFGYNYMNMPIGVYMQGNSIAYNGQFNNGINQGNNIIVGQVGNQMV